MSQLISATSPLPRAPTAKADPSAEPDGEGAAVDGFAALLAGLFALPVAVPPVAEPAKSLLLKGEPPIDALADDASPDDGSADQGTAGRPAVGNSDQEQPLGGDPTALSVAARGGVTAGNAEVAVPMPPRGGGDMRAPPPPVDVGPAIPSSGEAKPTTPPTGTLPVAPAAAAVERRLGDMRAASERSPTAAAATRDDGETARSRTGPGIAQPTTPTAQRVALNPIPGFGRLGLAWQAKAADPGAPAPLPGLVAADAVASSAERTAVAIADQATGGTARPVQQLALAIERAVNGEIRQLTIQLSPRELGMIEIALDLDADRRLSIAILAERPETLDLLRQDSRQLERLLGQQGLNLSDAGLEFGLMSQDRREGGEPPLPATLHVTPASETDGDAETGTAPSALGTAHRLNLSI